MEFPRKFRSRLQDASRSRSGWVFLGFFFLFGDARTSSHSRLGFHDEEGGRCPPAGGCIQTLGGGVFESLSDGWSRAFSGIFCEDAFMPFSEKCSMRHRRRALNRLRMVDSQVYYKTKGRRRHRLRAFTSAFDLVLKWVICFNAVGAEWS